MKAQEMKQRALDALLGALPEVDERLAAVDGRLLDYVADVARNEGDTHNLMEVLGALKFLRVFVTYPFDVAKVQQIYRWFEGRWEDHRYVEGSGGLMFSGLRGLTHYELTPVQVFIFAWIYGPHRWVNTRAAAGSRALLPTEEVRDGEIWDLRRLVTEANIFVTRKFGKTMMAAFCGFLDFMFGDVNSEIFCTANSQEQSKLIFTACKNMIAQLDPRGRYIRFTATEVNWRPFQPRQSKLQALSAGGKTKDGLFASLCLADEYGSATYVKDHSDMAALVSVVQSSMGPRREPLTIFTSTASQVMNGPYRNKLDGIIQQMKDEFLTTNLTN